ncbi:hypothetical protein DMA15_12515 [Streptomyces sp. WAC 01529]|uniref:hypothetical protein n=1 Tax=Streptomyces sp. WAC 01529 TaxID=2203205 RepID=UPI000F6E2755|nr:hypothetical protein [Streptomyces sp. WAC 01529]AZM53308.1 hypothetical protein DMA15_12515 [Streptomyces sp. WAC 01529]
MSRRRAAPDAPTIPGTAVAPPRRAAEDVLTARPVPAVEGQIDLVEHWLDCGLLSDAQRAALGGDDP